MLDAGHGAYLARQADLAGHAPAFFDGRIDIAAQHGGNDGEVHGHVGHSQTAGNIQEYVFLHQLEAHALFQHGQEHIQSALVEAGG